MQNRFNLNGVPNSIARDGWWLDGPTSPAPTGGQRDQFAGAIFKGRMIGLLVLIAVADTLFWNRVLGISLAIFALTIFVVATATIPARRTLVRPTLLLLFGVLPVVDSVQALSVVFLVAALAIALVCSRHPQASVGTLVLAGAMFLLRLPRQWGSSLLLRGKPLQVIHFLPGPRQFLRNWAFPIGGTLVFLALLMDANPMASRLFRLDLDLWSMAERLLFWLGVGVLISPILSKDISLGQFTAKRPLRRLPQLGINAGSVLRALGMFNLLIGFQVVADVSILLGGAELPRGLSYADYAHRGAYPLLMTAILAGAFALAARPFLAEHRLIRPLMVLWLAQNVVLCGAAALRLDLYICAYGLTYLRIYALIWMGLVAVGLALTLWQVMRGRDTLWLVLRAASLTVATLYLCSFVNFAQIIAAQNLGRDLPDLNYVCSLGPMAGAAWAEAEMQIFEYSPPECSQVAPRPIAHWQEWGFRAWSVNRYIARAGERSVLHEDFDRR